MLPIIHRAGVQMAGGLQEWRSFPSSVVNSIDWILFSSLPQDDF